MKTIAPMLKALLWASLLGSASQVAAQKDASKGDAPKPETPKEAPPKKDVPNLLPKGVLPKPGAEPSTQAQSKTNQPATPADTGTKIDPNKPLPKEPVVPKVKLPLAPTKDELDQKAKAQKQLEELEVREGSGRPAAYSTEKYPALRRVPTRPGSTAGPGGRAGSKTAEDRKAATLEVVGPQHGVRR